MSPQPTIVAITKEDGSNVILPKGKSYGQFVRNDFPIGSGIYYVYFSDGSRETIGGSVNGFSPSYINVYKTNIQISPIDTNVTFDNFYKTADIDHLDGTAEITINNTGIYVFTVKLNDNGADNRIYRLQMDGLGGLPNSVNGKANIIVAADNSIQVEVVMNGFVIIDQPGRMLRVNAPFGCGLDTPPVPLSVPIAIKASLTLFKIGNL